MSNIWYSTNIVQNARYVNFYNDMASKKLKITLKVKGNCVRWSLFNYFNKILFAIFDRVIMSFNFFLKYTIFKHEFIFRLTIFSIHIVSYRSELIHISLVVYLLIYKVLTVQEHHLLTPRPLLLAPLHDKTAPSFWVLPLPPNTRIYLLLSSLKI